MKKILFVGLLIALCCAKATAVTDVDSIATEKLCRQSWRRSLVGASSAIAVNAALTEVLKNNITASRPDGSGNHSFPSRHASYAFTFASVASHELYRFSPLWVSASHTLANAVAMQRVYASRHYPCDVLAGATLGLGSAELGYCLSRWIFPSDACYFLPYEYCNQRSLTTSTTALITFCSHKDGVAVGCGVESSLGANFSLCDNWGIGASVRMRSHPVYINGGYVGGLNGMAISADGYACQSFGYWQADAAISLGLIYNFDCPQKVAPRFAPLFDLTAGVQRMVARGLSVGPRIGIDITKRPSALCALTVSFVAKAEF